jgi:hypothetical protein
VGKSDSPITHIMKIPPRALESVDANSVAPL